MADQRDDRDEDLRRALQALESQDLMEAVGRIVGRHVDLDGLHGHRAPGTSREDQPRLEMSAFVLDGDAPGRPSHLSVLRAWVCHRHFQVRRRWLTRLTGAWGALVAVQWTWPALRPIGGLTFEVQTLAVFGSASLYYGTREWWAARELKRLGRTLTEPSPVRDPGGDAAKVPIK